MEPKIRPFIAALFAYLFFLPAFAQVPAYPPANQNYPAQQFVTGEPDTPPVTVQSNDPSAGTLSNQPANQILKNPPAPNPAVGPPAGVLSNEPANQVVKNPPTPYDYSGQTPPNVGSYQNQAITQTQSNTAAGQPAGPQPAPAPLPNMVPPLAPGITTPPDLAPPSAPDMTVPPDLAPNPAPEMTVPPDLAPSPAPGITQTPDLAPPSAPDAVPQPMPEATSGLGGQNPSAPGPSFLAGQPSANPLAGGLIEDAFTSCWRLASGFCITANSSDSYRKCLDRLKPYPACQQFISFANFTQFGKGDDVDYMNFYKDAQLYLFHIQRYQSDYPGDYYALGIKGNMINLTSGQAVQQIDISKDVLYPQLAQNFPKVGLWSFVDQPPVAQSLPQGGMRLTFRFTLLNGCATCEKAGYAFIAYDFNASGELTNTQLISLEAGNGQ